MSTEDRREFLKQLAKGTAYAAPVVYTLAAPIEVAGQGQGGSMKQGGGQGGGGSTSSSTSTTSPFPPPPGGNP